MGFPSKEYFVVLPKPVVLFFLFLGYIKFIVLMVFYCFGLYQPLESLISPLEEYEFYFLDDIEVSPSTTISPFEIKKQLKAVEFASLAHKCHVEEDENNDDSEPTCVICLGNLEAKHKVRELKNCVHIFHVECIDRWMDAGRLSCPLCRVGLLPTHSKDGKWAKLSSPSLGLWG